jgi:hypothetical protein
MRETQKIRVRQNKKIQRVRESMKEVNMNHISSNDYVAIGTIYNFWQLFW